MWGQKKTILGHMLHFGDKKINLVINIQIWVKKIFFGSGRKYCDKISYLLFLLIFIQYKIKKYIDNKMLIEIIKNLIF